MGKKLKKKDKADVSDPLPLLLQGFELVAKEDEWVYLSSMGHVLRQLDPAFDPRTYGHERLQSLIGKYPKDFTLKRDDSRTPPVVYVALAAQRENAADS